MARWITNPAALLLSLLIAPLGCAQAGADPEEYKEGSADSQPAEPVVGSMKEQVQYARQNLAGRLGIATSAIEVVEASEVQWRNSSMGCPRPGMQYAQVITNGVLIRLRAEGEVWRYHGGREGEPFLCESGAQAPLTWSS